MSIHHPKHPYNIAIAVAVAVVAGGCANRETGDDTDDTDDTSVEDTGVVDDDTGDPDDTGTPSDTDDTDDTDDGDGFPEHDVVYDLEDDAEFTVGTSGAAHVQVADFDGSDELDVAWTVEFGVPELTVRFDPGDGGTASFVFVGSVNTSGIPSLPASFMRHAFWALPGAGTGGSDALAVVHDDVDDGWQLWVWSQLDGVAERVIHTSAQPDIVVTGWDSGPSESFSAFRAPQATSGDDDLVVPTFSAPALVELPASGEVSRSSISTGNLPFQRPGASGSALIPDVDGDGLDDGVNLPLLGGSCAEGEAEAEVLAMEIDTFSTSSLDVLGYLCAPTDVELNVNNTYAGGDFNGDGETDVVLGTPLDDTDAEGAGSIHVFFGPFAGGATYAPDVTLRGMAAEEGLLGRSVSNLGDLDDDGTDDLGFVGSMDGDPEATAFVFLGSSLSNADPDTTVYEADIALYRDGARLANASPGMEIFSVPDASGDGLPDLVVWDVDAVALVHGPF